MYLNGRIRDGGLRFLPKRQTLPSVGSRRNGDSARSLLGGVLLFAFSCSEYRRFDSVAWLRAELEERLGAEQARQVPIPFELESEVLERLSRRVSFHGSDARRAHAILEFVSGDLGLRYVSTPTRSAGQTLAAREANCLSFVNLFVALARALRLPAFYVEVEDAQTWNVVGGTVVSRGHIVAGMYVDGSLRTYDFLPGARNYRKFRPVDDRTALAHYLNNLGAEALLAGDPGSGCEWTGLASRVAPEFHRAWNNLGVCRSRLGDRAGAEEALRAGLGIAPEDPALLSNLLRLLQAQRRFEEARVLISRLEALEIDQPLFYLYLSEDALAQGEPRRALDFAREAYRRASALPEVHVGLARAYLALGEVERARHHLARALELDATHAEARRLIEALQG